MALTKCQECGKDISTTAQTCPHCGAKPSGRKAKDTATSGARIILMTLGILSALPALAFGGGVWLMVPVLLILIALVLR